MAATDSSKKRKRGKNWSSQETILLIEAKQAIGSKEGMASAAAKWQAIADLLESQGVLRDVEQCRSKWENMLGDYRSIIEYEKRAAAVSSATSYFALSKEQKKELKLPGKFPDEIFQLLGGGRPDTEIMDVPAAAAAAPPSNSLVALNSAAAAALTAALDSVSKSSEDLTAIPLAFRDVGSSGMSSGRVPAVSSDGKVFTNAEVGTSTAKTKRRSQQQPQQQPQAQTAGLSAADHSKLTRAISESHDKLMAFLRDRDARRNELEEQKLLLEKQRFDALREDMLKVVEVLNAIALSWRKVSDHKAS